VIGSVVILAIFGLVQELRRNDREGAHLVSTPWPDFDIWVRLRRCAGVESYDEGRQSLDQGQPLSHVVYREITEAILAFAPHLSVLFEADE